MSARHVTLDRLVLCGYLMVCSVAACTAARGQRRVSDARAAVEDLLTADRRFAADARLNALRAISNMLDDDVWMPMQGGFTRDRQAALAALRTAFGSDSVRAEWTPIRGGIAADGRHGFTFGYMTLLQPDSLPSPMKYLSYWVKGTTGWRVAAYRVARRPAGDVSRAVMEPALPERLVAPTADPAAVVANQESLIAAERAFSHRAQEIGLGPAFVEKGSADAVNMGGAQSASFVVGSEAIGHAVSGGVMGPPSPVSWDAERAIVASSGDLGVTFGLITPNAAPANRAPARVPFFTIWRRLRPTNPWRYIAE